MSFLLIGKHGWRNRGDRREHAPTFFLEGLASHFYISKFPWICLSNTISVWSIVKVNRLKKKNFWRAHVTHRWRPQRFFQGGGPKTTFCLSVLGCGRRHANWRTQNALPFLRHKENVQCYGNSCKQRSIWENLHWANVSLSDHEYLNS